MERPQVVKQPGDRDESGVERQARPPAPVSIPDHPSAVALMDATDRLLGEVGYARISSRKITDLAGLAHGSIRYHFGSLQGLLVATLRRSNEAGIERQRRLYREHGAADIWRIATRTYLEEDIASGWALRLVESLLIGIRDPAAGQALAEVLDPWRRLIRQGTEDAAAEFGLDLDDRLLDGIATLIETQQVGMLIYRLAGHAAAARPDAAHPDAARSRRDDTDLDQHHEAALDAVDALLAHLASRARDLPDNDTQSHR
ncbi:TetR/AcrR family transcriptional regulator [Actinomadura sp. 9N215]|uniref:TetR/AcrR family transcriptional regulator n=1 Tax=Actinomadura sp. 9N215 TaxID=3375150 RepID=UPI003787CA0B